MSQYWWSLGKWLYGIPLSITGLIYLFFPQTAAESLTSFLPGGYSLIYVAGALFVALGLSLVFDFFTTYATWGIIILLIAFQIMVHIPAATSGQNLSIVWFELLRDLSLLGGACFIMAVEGHRIRARQKGIVEA